MSRTSIKECDGIRLKNFILAGAQWLFHHKNFLDQINFFPVPDGDTGANMYMTFTSILNEMRKVENPYATSAIARAAAIGALMGSKGNSGMILSQFFRGFSESIGDKEILEADDIAHAFKRAAQTAREGVLEPKEGTILTVADAGACASLQIVKKSDDFIEVIRGFHESAQGCLKETRHVQPENIAAGVVDAGAQGLVVFFEGMLRLGSGSSVKKPPELAIVMEQVSVEGKLLKYQYCTTFILQKHNEIVNIQVRNAVVDMGDSVVIDKGIDNFLKVHIHTNDPDQVLETISEFGSISNIMIDDMKRQIVDK